MMALARKYVSLPISARLSRAEAQVLYDLLPATEQAGPVGLGLTSVLLWTPGEVDAALGQMFERSAAEGDDEMRALAWWRRVQLQGDTDPDALVVPDELAALAEDGWPLARSAVALVRSHAAQEERDVETALAVLDDLGGPDPQTRRWRWPPATSPSASPSWSRRPWKTCWPRGSPTQWPPRPSGTAATSIPTWPGPSPRSCRSPTAPDDSRRSKCRCCRWSPPSRCPPVPFPTLVCSPTRRSAGHTWSRRASRCSPTWPTRWSRWARTARTRSSTISVSPPRSCRSARGPPGPTWVPSLRSGHCCHRQRGSTTSPSGSP